MNFNDLFDILHSDSGKLAAAKNCLFGATRALVSATVAYEAMSRSAQFLDLHNPERASNLRASEKYQNAQHRCEQAAIKAATMHAIAESRTAQGFALSWRDDAPRLVSMSESAQIAEACKHRFTAEQIHAKRQLNADKQFQRSTDAASMAEAMFWSAPRNEEDDNNIDLTIKTATVVKALQSTMDWMFTWNSVPYGEIAVLSDDLDTVEAILLKEEALAESEGQLGMQHTDEAVVDPKAQLAALKAKYDAAIKTQRTASAKAKRAAAKDAKAANATATKEMDAIAAKASAKRAAAKAKREATATTATATATATATTTTTTTEESA